MNWYIDPINGSNENSGHSMNKALKDLSLFIYNGESTPVLNHGDKIFIKKGTTLQCNNVKLYANNYDFKIHPFVYVGAYGSGNNPKLVNYIKVERKDLVKYSNTTYYINVSDSNIGFIYDEKQDKIYGNRVFNKSGLKNNMDFYTEGERLYIYADNFDAIPEHLILPVAGTIMTTDANTVYDGLHFTLGGSHGVSTTNDGNYNIVIKNCRFDKLGGSKLSGTTRFGNGVEIYGGGYDIQVENCIFEDIFDTGVTFQGENATFKNCSFNNNLFKRCNQACENWCDNATSGEGYINCSFNNNISMLCGYGFGGLNRDLAYHFMLTKANCQNTDITVKNNVFFKSKNGAYQVPNLLETDLKINNNKIYLYDNQVNSLLGNNDDVVFLDINNKDKTLENIMLASDLFMNSIDKLITKDNDYIKQNNQLSTLKLESYVIENLKSNSLTVVNNQVFINLKGKLKSNVSSYSTFCFSNNFDGFTCDQQYINDSVYVNIANGQLYLQANKELTTGSDLNISGVFTIKEV